MAKAAYIGVNNVARKIKGGYIGVNGVARKIKAAYVGVGGVARPAWPSGGVTTFVGSVGSNYSDTIEVTGKTGDYVLAFAGDCTAKALHNSSYTLTNATNWNTSTSDITTYVGGTSGNGNYAMVGGGWDYDNEKSLSTMFYYNSSLTKSSASALRTATEEGGYSWNDSYILIAGGINESTDYISYVTAYNNSMTRSYGTNLGEDRYFRSGNRGFKLGSYAIFGRERTYTRDRKAGYMAEAYNTSLTRTELTIDSGYARVGLGGAQIGSTGLFTEATAAGSTSTVSSYTTSLTYTKNALSALPAFNGFSVTNDLFAVFSNGTATYNVNPSLTVTAGVNLSTDCQYGGLSLVSNNTIFARPSTSNIPFQVIKYN